MTAKTLFTGPAGHLAKEGVFRLPLMVLEVAAGGKVKNRG